MSGDQAHCLTTRGEPACVECYRTKLKCVSKLLIINEILVEATGVELITILITRNLLILGTATKAKKAPLPDPLYVYCTVNSLKKEKTPSTAFFSSILSATV